MKTDLDKALAEYREAYAVVDEIDAKLRALYQQRKALDIEIEAFRKNNDAPANLADVRLCKAREALLKAAAEVT